MCKPHAVAPSFGPLALITLSLRAHDVDQCNLTVTQLFDTIHLFCLKSANNPLHTVIGVFDTKASVLPYSACRLITPKRP